MNFTFARTVRTAFVAFFLGVSLTACAQMKSIAEYKGILADPDPLPPPAERWLVMWRDSSGTISLDTRRIVTGLQINVRAELPLVWWRFDYARPQAGKGHYGETRFVALSFVECRGLRFAQSSAAFYDASGNDLFHEETHMAPLHSADPESASEKVIVETCKYLRTHRWPIVDP